MPFPRNYLEELIAEHMQIEEYFVITNLPRQKGGKGGREEFDVLGVRINSKGECELWHVEADRARSKKEREDKIKRQLLGPNIDRELNKSCQTSKRKKWFVSDDITSESPAWKELKEMFMADGVELVTFEELIQKIETAITNWKNNHPTKKGKLPAMLPENLWLLKMLEKMFERKMLKVYRK